MARTRQHGRLASRVAGTQALLRFGAWSRLRESFWFVPGFLCLAAVLLAEGLILLDRRLDDTSLGAFGAVIARVGESGSRDLLGAVAGSMLAVASTTFSITIAVLALSSSTYGPRLVRNFMADRGNQFVLGIFVATFLYSLIVLRSIRVVGDGDEDYFVPHLAVNVAVLLAVVAIAVLVYFIHHISDSVQVWTLAELVRSDLTGAIERLRPDDAREEAHYDTGDDPETLPLPPNAGARAVTARQTGYVVGIDLTHLTRIARKSDAVLHVAVRPGDHVIHGAVLARLWPPGEHDDSRDDSVREAVHVGRARTPDEDIEFPALLLEEMAVRALSPGTNDPYTAINALDDLAGGLVMLAGRPTPSPRRYDGDGRLRVIAPNVSLTQLVDHVLTAMRVYAITHPTVLHRTLELADQVGNASESSTLRRHLVSHVRDLVQAFAATSPHSRDLDALSQHAGRVRSNLGHPGTV